MNKEYVLNVFLPAIGMLEGAAIFRHEKVERFVIWAWVPAIVALWAAAHRSGEFIPTEILIAVPLLVLYGLWWVFQGIHASLRAPAGSPLERGFWSLYAVAVPAAFAATASELGDHRPGAWVWPLLCAFGIAALLAIRGGRGAGAIEGVVGPMIGLQGLPYFRQGRRRAGAVSLVVGWVLLALYLWMIIGTAQDPQWPVAEFTVVNVALIWLLAVAPFAYIALWLWVAIDSDEIRGLG